MSGFSSLAKTGLGGILPMALAGKNPLLGALSPISAIGDLINPPEPKPKKKAGTIMER